MKTDGKPDQNTQGKYPQHKVRLRLDGQGIQKQIDLTVYAQQKQEQSGESTTRGLAQSSPR